MFPMPNAATDVSSANTAPSHGRPSPVVRLAVVERDDDLGELRGHPEQA
jgi:hypothetical protein